MHQGIVAAATASTITFPAAPVYTAFTTPSIYDDFYNAMEVIIVSGTGVGQRRPISDYTGGSTYQATISEDWTVTPDTSSGYAVISPVPEGFHDVQVLDAAMGLASKSPRRKVAEISGLRNQRYLEMLGYAHNRQTFRDDLVIPDLSTGVY